MLTAAQAMDDESADRRVQRSDDVPVQTAADAFKLLSDPIRLRVMWALSNAELDVTTLTQRVGASQARVSQHLAPLRRAGLVDRRREGKRVLYRARSPRMRDVIAEAFRYADETRSDVVGPSIQGDDGMLAG